MDPKTSAPTPRPPLVFVSYSHKDEKWKDRLLPHLQSLAQAGVELKPFHDRMIDGGSHWYADIRDAMENAAAAVVLISANFLASDFCVKEEARFLMERRAKLGMPVIPVLLRACDWEVHPWLSALQMLPRDGKCVVPNFTNRSDVVFREVAQTIHRHFRAIGASPAAASAFPAALRELLGPAKPAPVVVGMGPARWPVIAPDRVDLTHLPETGSALFGREQELRMLDEAWAAGAAGPARRIVALTADGGVGKTTLVNRWLDDMKREQYRGADRVFGWSFYAQGMAGGHAASSDAFIEAALRFFGDADPSRGSTWDRGERLARLVGAGRQLLVLDGLEPLQAAGGFDRGRVLDAAVDALLRGLARQSRALCIVTTRQSPRELVGRAGVEVCGLDEITQQAGRALLRVAHVVGTDAELETLAGTFGPHALSISLLGVYLAQQPGQGPGPAEALAQLPGPTPLDRVLAGFEQWLGAGPALQALQLLALFDRPADAASLRTLRAGPAIAAFNDSLVALDEVSWERLLERLGRLRLVRYQRGDGGDDAVDMHPMLGAHFGGRLRAAAPAAWQQGHARLSEHFAALPGKVLPDTFEEMRPLFRALEHGCKAGRHQAMHDDIYAQRMSRGPQHYATRFLGVVGAELAAVANFFDTPWTRPSPNLDAPARAMVLRSAGFLLRALGRTAEAMQAMSAGIEAEDETSAASLPAQSEAALYLSEMSADMGQLEAAWVYAKHAFLLASEAGHEAICIAALAQTGALHHQRGRWAEALACFERAEQRQRQVQPFPQTLTGLGGFNYCALLLEWPAGAPPGHDLLARARAIAGEPSPADSPARAGEFPASRPVSVSPAKPPGEGLTGAYPRRDRALAALMIGRVKSDAAEAGQVDRAGSALRWIHRGLQRLRVAETMHLQPLGYIARARARCRAGAFDEAATDLDRAFEIAERGGMQLCLADIRLARAELFHAAKPYPWDQPTRDLAIAQELIERCGYGRRRHALEAAAISA